MCSGSSASTRVGSAEMIMQIIHDILYKPGLIMPLPEGLLQCIHGKMPSSLSGQATGHAFMGRCLRHFLDRQQASLLCGDSAFKGRVLNCIEWSSSLICHGFAGGELVKAFCLTLIKTSSAVPCLGHPHPTQWSWCSCIQQSLHWTLQNHWVTLQSNLLEIFCQKAGSICCPLNWASARQCYQQGTDSNSFREKALHVIK